VLPICKSSSKKINGFGKRYRFSHEEKRCCQYVKVQVKNLVVLARGKGLTMK
jgi:hypothetical protein